MMDEIIIPKELINTAIKKAMPGMLEDAFGSSYDNPLKDAIEASVEGLKEEINRKVDEAISELVQGDAFKKSVVDSLLSKYIRHNED